MTRQTPQWLQNGTYAAAQDRMLIGALWPLPRSTGLAVTATTGMTLNVAPGQVAIPSPNQTGSTLCTSDATEQVVIGAAPVTGSSRIDLIVATARGGDLDGGANDDFVFQVIPGTVVASPTTPVAPAVPAGSVALAQVLVGGGVATIVPGNITDRRPGTLVVPSGPRGCVATGPALAGNAVNAVVPLNSVVTGAPWLAANTITIPAGAGGLYAVGLDLAIMVASVVANGGRVTNNAGAALTPPMELIFLTDSFSGSWWYVVNGYWIAQLPDGQTLQVRAANIGTGGQIQVRRLSVIRLGDALTA